VSYSRFRHDACSDPCRIKRQQQIEHLVIAKLKNDKFNDLTHIGSLIDVIRKNVDTNLTADEMKSLGWAFRDVNIADIHSTQVPFLSDKQLGCCGDVLIPDEAGKAKMVADFIGPYYAATPPPSLDALAAVVPSSLHVAVRNGSGVPGLGAKVAAVLKRDGYIVTSVANADSFDFDTTVIRASAGTPLAGERVRSDIQLPAATISPVPVPSSSAAVTAPAKASGPDVTVIVGRDYLNAGASPVPSASAK
jgi:hypothetical protein